jgi:hypothetical protein
MFQDKSLYILNLKKTYKAKEESCSHKSQNIALALLAASKSPCNHTYG